MHFGRSARPRLYAGGGAEPIGHVDLRVRDMAAALAFHEAVLPSLGYTERYDGPEWKVFAAPVDRVAAVAAEAGAADLSGPKETPYGPDYYAVYFAGPSGNRFEVYHRLEG